jgi:hypothetical protein
VKICSIEGCCEKYFAKGFCKIHYGRYYRHGDPSIVLRKKKSSRLCCIKECGGLFYAKGYCQYHYKQIRQYGKIKWINPREYVRKTNIFKKLGIELDDKTYKTIQSYVNKQMKGLRRSKTTMENLRYELSAYEKYNKLSYDEILLLDKLRKELDV